MMTRRGLFANLFVAPFAARFLPPLPPLPSQEVLYATPALDELNAATIAALIDADINESLRPFCFSGYSYFDGGTTISEPFTYAPAAQPDTQVNSTIHNLQTGDGANQ